MRGSVVAMKGHLDLQRASVGAVVCALVAVFVPFEVVRLIAALPLALVLPGYAIVAAGFGVGEPAPPKLWALSVGISLMVLTLGALLLNVFPFGLTTVSWAVLLVAVVIGGCLGAAGRRETPRRRRRPAPGPARPSLLSAGLIAGAVAIAVAALVLAQKPLAGDNAVGFTALWMLPANASEEAVVVGVLSSEQDRATYNLRVAQVGKGRAKSYRLSLDPGEERTFALTVPRGPGMTHVVASLYRSERPHHLYRRVTSWLPRQKTFPQGP